MSMIFCSDGDHLVDSDGTLFIYDEETRFWTCEDCLHRYPNLDVEKVLDDFNVGIKRSGFLKQEEYVF